MMPNKMQTIGFVGFGSLGSMLGMGFSNKFNIVYYDPNVNDKQNDHKRVDSLKLLVKKSDIIIVATPASEFNKVINELVLYDIKDKLIIDVLSTKVLAGRVYKNNSAHFNNILSLHPLFEPPSNKYFIKDMRIVVCQNDGTKAKEFCNVLKNDYNFKLINKTAQEHDKHMALHHAVPFVLAHVLAKMQFSKNAGDLTIPTEEKLRRIVEIAGNESEDLYRSVVMANPYAQEAINELLQALQQEKHKLWSKVD
ncbi:prephenate dehydrogenase [Candidatus Saccharibacteria bacterium]|nr:prephenate dehydrogenase [Candidatus Saccharibacteria bacterium]